MDDDKRKIDWAPTVPDAIAMRDMYRKILDDVPAFSKWLVGYERDPAPVHGIHGYVIYCRPRPEKPGDVIEPTKVIPPQKAASQLRHVNRNRKG